MAALTLGTRGSDLALWQARHVQQRLEAAGHVVRLEIVTTTGDRILDTPLSRIGEKALFTKELDVALLEGRIDLAVHSLKDLPTRLPEGIVLAAVSAREAPWDAFVAHPSFVGGLGDLPEGATVATSSLRREAQLRAWRPDLRVVSVRGNVDTRLRKLEESTWHGMVLAVAGLVRLGLAGRIREVFAPARMLPAVGQGALGIVCAAARPDVAAALGAALHDAATAAATTAERAFLRRLEGGCQVPIGAHACLEEGHLALDGLVAALDGHAVVRGQERGAPGEAEALGTALAERLLAEGAQPLLDAARARGAG